MKLPCLLALAALVVHAATVSNHDPPPLALFTSSIVADWGSLSSFPVYELTFHAFVPVRVHERVCARACVCVCVCACVCVVAYSVSLNETVRLHVRL